MSTGGGGYVIQMPIDPSIIIDYGAAKALVDMFPREIDDNLRIHCLMMNDGIYIATSRCRQHLWFGIKTNEKYRKTHVSVPLGAQGLNKDEVETLLAISKCLEIYGWTYDEDVCKDWEKETVSCDYPLPENRAEFIELLKKVYTLPMTKRALT
tara:strand:+ start:10736 stop:11194 length:459 start_codon:yes stop_codon:yes gene_type:complete